MSAVADAALTDLVGSGPRVDAPPEPVAFHYTQTESFVALLQQLGASLLVSTYQANKLLAVRASGQGISTLVRTIERPMGLAVDARRLTIGTRNQLWFLRNAPDIAPRVEPVEWGAKMTSRLLAALCGQAEFDGNRKNDNPAT